MNTGRKVITGVLVAAMALTALLVGTVSADDEDITPGPQDSILARVAELLNIDQDDLEAAFTQAREEQREERQAEMEAAREAQMQKLVDQGIITQKQADEWNEWMESRPEVGQQLQEWLQARPDMGEDFPFGDGRGMRMAGRMPRGGMMGGMGPFGRYCPAQSEN